MAITIIIPVFNKEEFICKTIQSVLNQDFENFELIIVNDGSTDNSLKKIRSFIDHRIFVYSIRNSGISAARNFGIRIARNNLIAFLDADDVWKESYLTEIVELSRHHKGALAFISGYIKKYSSGDQNVRVNGIHKFGVLRNYWNYRIKGWGVHTSSVVVSRQLLLDIGGFPLFLSSFKNRVSFVVDINGNILFECPFELVEGRGRWVDISETDLGECFKDFIGFRVLLPCILGEDQFVWDCISLRTNFVYTTSLLSIWNGDVPNQASKNRSLIPVAAHLKMLSLNNKFNDDLVSYQRLLEGDLIIRFSFLKSKLFKKMLDYHGYFERNTFMSKSFNSILFKIFVIIKSIFLRVIKKIKSLYS